MGAKISIWGTRHRLRLNLGIMESNAYTSLGIGVEARLVIRLLLGILT